MIPPESREKSTQKCRFDRFLHREFGEIHGEIEVFHPFSGFQKRVFRRGEKKFQSHDGC